MIDLSDEEEIKVILDALSLRYELYQIIDVAIEMVETEEAVFDCLDCDKNTLHVGEYYMVNDALWYSVVPDGEGMLCFDCLEKRIDRKLVRSDLTDAPINHKHRGSERFN